MGSKAYSSTCRTIAKEAADLMGMQEEGMANHYIGSPLEGRGRTLERFMISLVTKSVARVALVHDNGLDLVPCT